MKRIITLLLLPLFALGALMPKSDMEELYKIPFLIEHYTQSHQNLNFLDFLAQHYQENTHTDQDHEKLPFKHHQHQGLQIFDVLISELPELKGIKITYLSSNYLAIFSSNYHSLAFAIPSPPPQFI